MDWKETVEAMRRVGDDPEGLCSVASEWADALQSAIEERDRRLAELESLLLREQVEAARWRDRAARAKAALRGPMIRHPDYVQHAINVLEGRPESEDV